MEKTHSQRLSISRVKAKFMKRVLRAGKTAPSRFTYILMRGSYFIENVRMQLFLPYETTLQVLHMKRYTIWSKFYATDAMITKDWTKPNYELQHILICYAIHGFHHLICTKKRFHNLAHDCIYELGNSYHVEKCKGQTYINHKILYK